MSQGKWENNEEIKIFREYLRIPTVHPNVDYTGCVEFLKRQAASLELPVEVICPVVETKPVVVIKWLGKQPELPSIILNSHTDVVPVFADKWTHPPFGADIDAEGRIFARGAQDMKCVGTQYLGAVRALKASGFQPKRTVYLTYVPDEEIGGHLGMRDLVQMDYFKKLNVGFSFDEGIASEDNTYALYYAERTLWHLRFKISGTAGHGSLLLTNTAGEKLNYLVNKMMEFRASQVKRLEQDPNIDIGNVTTVNLTQAHGGVQSNVVPPILEVTFDIRIAIDVDVAAFEQQIRNWCAEAGGGIELDFEMKNPYVPPTKIDASNPYWLAFKQTLDELGLKVRTCVFPGATDSRYVREVGIPALGFSPINNTPILLHDHDEFLRADTYLHGIEVYKKLISAVANA
ncbi:aminoacylase-1-like [Scaptodrosophila lebanonensis]|uniref:N-acyl-aliphatic-L-amino acid amidohydrolase n=1 Tax=Drosophila lebanonensis TaxID=7225 RepID=A0A6J2TPR9_DROLE|nr:aminoacylase-1-like [Scaptodrosophila lebanonensis]XP_030378041.1 aminoacylase-1-like [Scaptodrosophila lebanonensis]